VFALASAQTNLNVNVSLFPNGLTNMSTLADEFSASDLFSRCSVVMSYVNATDNKTYGTYLEYVKGVETFPVDLSVPYHIFTDADYSDSDCTLMDFDYCINLSDFTSLEVSDGYVEVLSAVGFFKNPNWRDFEYSAFWQAPFNFTDDLNLSITVPVFEHTNFETNRAYRNGGKIGVVIKHLSSTSSVWADSSISDRFAHVIFSDNSSDLACYGIDNFNTGSKLCSVSVTGSSAKIVSNGATYTYFYGNDFTSPLVHYDIFPTYSSSKGINQVYWDGDGNTNVLVYNFMYPIAFSGMQQDSFNTTTCDLSTFMPLDDGSCYRFSSSYPTGRYIYLESGFIAGIAGIAMVLVALAACYDFMTGGHIVKSINEHFSNIGRQIK
jgi:hypothetical protein